MTTESAAPENARTRSQVESRRRILTAAVAALAANGGEKTTIAATATRAALAPGTVYLHFRDKESLVEAATDHALDRMREYLAQKRYPTANSAMDDARVKATALVAFARDDPEAAGVVFGAARGCAPAGAGVRKFLQESQLRGIESGRKRGWYRQDLGAEICARALVGATSAVISAWLDGGRQEDPATLVRELANLRVRGLGADR